MKNDGTACLADLGQTSIFLDTGTADVTSSAGDEFIGGITRWTSPELIYPEKFGLQKPQVTRESDCYAFGMVVYEVSS